LAKPALATAMMMVMQSGGSVRLINIMPLTPVMLAEYVPADFEAQQRKSAEEALAIVSKETGLDPARVSSVVRQGGIYQEILEEANAMKADLIVMTSHRPQRPAVRTYFLGSNAGHVVRYAKCSVLVVRQRPGE
jgi:nucleotide-binding universal stress UspA family protein